MRGGSSFAVDAEELYIELYGQASAEADANTLGWLAAAGYGYQGLRTENTSRVRCMSLLSTLLGASWSAQTVLWLTALGVN